MSLKSTICIELSASAKTEMIVIVIGGVNRDRYIQNFVVNKKQPAVVVQNGVLAKICQYFFIFSIIECIKDKTQRYTSLT